MNRKYKKAGFLYPYTGLSPEVKGPERAANHLHVVHKLRVHGTIRRLLHMPSLRARDDTSGSV